MGKNKFRNTSISNNYNNNTQKITNIKNNYSKNKNIDSIIVNIFIVLFLLSYVYTIKSLLLYENGKFNFDFNNDMDMIYYFLLFLIIPLIITIIINYFHKIDFIKIYFLIFIIQWIIFLNVNPYPTQFDNKYNIMELIPSKYRPNTQFLLSDINEELFTYPIIIKPIYCSGNGYYIVIINNKYELDEYLKKCTNKNNFMVQNYLEDYKVEIGLLYEKMPFQKNGKIIEIVEKTNQNDKIRSFNDKHKKIHNNLINNSNLNNIINELSNMIPNMNVGRYDIRLKNIEDLEKGDFKIVEVNGTMGMSFDKYFDFQWYVRRIIIGLFNIITFKCYSPVNLPVAMYKSYYSMNACNDYENLFSLYS